MTVLLIALGAFVGAPTRYLTDYYVQAKHRFAMPIGTMTVNVAGSFILGLLTGALTSSSSSSSSLSALIGTGFCGALTTFSTFSFETLSLLERRASPTAVMNVGMSLVLGLGAASIGLWVGAL